MTLPKIAGVFLVTSLLANVTAFAIGTSRGLPPPACDFGDSQHLLRLSAESGSHQLPLTLSLMSPVLALPVGYAFFHVLRTAGWPAAFGAAPDFARPAIAAAGATVDLAIDVLGFVGHFFSFGLAQLAFGVAIIKVPNISNWLGGLSVVPAFMLGWMVPLLALLGQDVGPAAGIGIAVYFIWLVGMSVVLLRWQGQEAL